MKNIWKKALAVLLVATLACGASPAAGLFGLLAAAEPVGGTCGAEGGNLTWSLNTDTGVLTISGTGDMADYSEEDDAPWGEYRDVIQSVIIENGVTSIGDYAFYYYPALASAAIGADVTRIGESAFVFSALTDVSVPASVEQIGLGAFVCLIVSEDDDDITPTIQSINVDPANLIYASEDGVLYDKAETTLIQYPCGKTDAAFTIPDDVTTISGGAFILSLLLQSVTIPDSVTEIGESAFENCIFLEDVSIGNGVETIDSGAFNTCVSLQSITIPDGVTTISDNAFAGCESLASLTIGNGVETIGASAFEGCAALEDLTIPDHVTEIGFNAFAGCESFESVTIGAGVEEIGDFAFSACYALSEVTFNAVACTVMGSESGTAFNSCTALQTVVIGDAVTMIPPYAFLGAEELTAIVIPDSVTVIGANAFMNCSGLADVTLGSGLETISDYAFQNCSAITNIHIPSGVTEIGVDAFGYCGNLAYICSDAADCAAKTYAEANGIEFRQCGSVEPTTASGVCGAEGDNVTWTLDLETGALTISGTGAMANYDYSDDNAAPWAAYRESIRTLTVGSGVTNVGDFAFDECENLTTATIGNDVTIIGEAAFADCVSLSDLTLSDSLTVIGSSAFEFCTELSSITLPEGLTTVDEMAFVYTGLTSVFVPSTVEEIGYLAFACAVESPEGEPVPTLQRIDVDPENMYFVSEDGVLYNKSKTTLIQYPCAAAQTEFTIPDSVTAIGIGAFIFCMDLQKITIPDSVTTIGYDAFEYCTSLQKIVIPNGVTEIADSAFSDCTSLASVTIPDGVTSIGEYAFDGCAFTDIVIPDSVTAIGERAFIRCASLVNVTLGSGLETIGENAFCRCSSLATVTIPEQVSAIANSTFESCVNLESVHIPSAVTAISSTAFANCPNLAFLCSDTADCYAKTFAEENGIEFRLCTGHESGATTISGTCGAEGDNVLWALNLGNGEMILSGTGAMADYADAADAPWADYRASIQTVIVRSGVTTIGENAFFGCAPLTSVTIGEDVTAIGAGAFAQSALTNVAIPRNVQQIGSGAFDCFTSFDGIVPTVQAFAVDPENAFFCAQDGVLYNKAQTCLIRYPDADPRVTFVVPDTVTHIEAGAFKDASKLTSIHVPSAVADIGSDAFARCDNLEFLCSDDENCFVKTYAAENGLTFRLCVGHSGSVRLAGDANGDGVVNLKDVVLVRRYLADGWNVAIFAANADVDADNAVTLQDVVLVCRYLAGGWNVVLL